MSVIFTQVKKYVSFCFSKIWSTGSSGMYYKHIMIAMMIVNVEYHSRSVIDDSGSIIDDSSWG
jgi:hypothetical protein